MTQAITDSKQASAALAELFGTHKRVVFFGGAGVSTASGIPDFRSVDGLYHQRFAYPPETMLSHSFYEAHSAEFFDFYRTKMIELGAKPNRCHTKLAELEGACRQAKCRGDAKYRRSASDGGIAARVRAARIGPSQHLPVVRRGL